MKTDPRATPPAGFGARLEKAAFALTQCAVSVADVRSTATARRAEHIARVDREVAELPEAVAFDRMTARSKAAEEAACEIASQIEKAEAELTGAIIAGDEAKSADARRGIEKLLDRQRISNHERDVLQGAVKEAEKRRGAAVKAHRAAAEREYLASAQAEVRAAVDALRPLLETPDVLHLVATFAVAAQQAMEMDRNYMGSSPPWNAPDPVPVMVAS